MARGRKDYEKSVIAVESEGHTDLHGRTLMNDDFEDTPLKWTASGNGDWFVSRQARAAYNGSYGLELDITSNAPPTAQFAAVERYIPIDITERLLVELFWRANVTSRLYQIDITLDYRDGTHRHLIALRYRTATGYWEYWTPGGVFAIIPGSAQVFMDEAWNELSLSCDFAENAYIRMKSNNMEINMQELACWTQLSGLGAHVLTSMHAYNATADQLLLSTDDVAIKELEH